ncbi:MAG: M20/M25/M40 family metallo-hydrolase [Bacteroidales bacterium]|nr:M20/M25/M40 family metallo-hydrolase [Bacteroidales bacterium]
MKKNYCLLVFQVFLLFTGVKSFAQIAYSPFVDSLTQLATHNSVLLLTRQLAGDTTVTVNGQTTTIQSRHYLNPSNAKAADFIYDKFMEYGYTPEIQTFNGTRGENIIATKTGSKYPDNEFIICGHYDNMPSGSTAPGADDNASGTVAVLEAARILAPFDFDFTIRFAAWDEEEIGLVGSSVYAQSAVGQEHNILGVLNLDMIAWDSDNDYEYTISTNDFSQSFTNDFITTTGLYQPQFNHNYYYTEASDHASFWDYGYPAMLAIEDWYDFNEYYHTTGDDIEILNMDYYVAFVRASIANLAAQAWDQRIGMQHDPIPSGNSTDQREAVLVVSCSQTIASDEFAPRLYYSTNGISFDFILPVESAGNTYRFMVPGFPIGTEVRYFFALQDSLARMMATLPAGGKGISPAGTQPPHNFFTYKVDYLLMLNECSVNTPIAINDLQNTYDQIEISATGNILDLNVKVDISHPETGDLRLILTGPDATSLMLSDRNGGEGDNYTNTVFDDQAEHSISEGIPPYTGRFRPEFPLEVFNGKPVSGTWQIRVNDGGAGNTGTLENWCLQILYPDPSTGIEQQTNKNENRYLGQNFPNPASGSTSIIVDLPYSSDIKLTLFDLYGREVEQLASGHFIAGRHLLTTTLKHLEPGRYFYRLETENINETRSLVIIR